MTIDESNVFVQLISFPNGKTKEMVSPNSDGSFTVFLNANLTHEAQLEAYQHALLHIKQNDFEKSDVQEIEHDAHNTTVPVAAKRYTGEQFRKKIRTNRRQTEKELQKYEEMRIYLESI